MSFADWLFLPKGAQSNEDAAANIARLQAELRQQTADRVANGELTTPQADAIEQYIANVGGAESTNAAAASGFKEGLKEGAANLGSNLDKGFFGTLKAVLGQVPIFVWLGVAVVAFLWLGGGVWFVRKSKGVLAR